MVRSVDKQRVSQKWRCVLNDTFVHWLKWKDAEKYWAVLEEDSVWSRAFFSFIHVSFSLKIF